MLYISKPGGRVLCILMDGTGHYLC